MYAPNTIKDVPQSAGIYKYLNDKGSILYVGKAINLKKRISSYFHVPTDLDAKTSLLAKQIKSIDIIPVQSEFEALLLEAQLIKKYKPKYNIIWKDDKQYIYIKITNEEFPKISLSRLSTEKNAYLFGPFPSKKTVLNILSYIRTIIPFCTQTRISKKPCFYTHLKLCDPCPNLINKLTPSERKTEKKRYQKNIKQIKHFLQGKTNLVEKFLKKEMDQYSKKLEYENAVILRDKLKKLEFLLLHFQPAQVYIENPEFALQDWKSQCLELEKIIAPFFQFKLNVKRIECYDISNISGKFSSASMVTCIDGQPAKEHYRKFRIKTVTGPNDFASLAETVKRRLLHKEWEYPDLIIIDGGKPQLIAVSQILNALHSQIPIIGIAKQEEELVLPSENDWVKIKLEPNSKALQLVQRIRDEAHRFAHRYHEHLRLKYLLKPV